MANVPCPVWWPYKVALPLIILLLLCAGLSSCDPVKRSIKQAEKSEADKKRLLDWAILQDICKSDSGTKVKSDTVISYQTEYDTLEVSKTDTLYKNGSIVYVPKKEIQLVPKLVVKTVRIVDTVTVTKYDRDFEDVLKEQIVEKDKVIAKTETQRDEAKKWVWWFIGILIPFILLIVYIIYSRFKKSR